VDVSRRALFLDLDFEFRWAFGLGLRGPAEMILEKKGKNEEISYCEDVLSRGFFVSLMSFCGNLRNTLWIYLVGSYRVFFFLELNNSFI
jgi:hypothetical protein